MTMWDGKPLPTARELRGFDEPPPLPLTDEQQRAVRSLVEGAQRRLAHAQRATRPQAPRGTWCGG